MLTSYPPMPCGIGAYAAQHAESLRAEGHSVDIAGPPEAQADFEIAFAPVFRPFRLARLAWAYGRVIIQYTPSFYYNPASGASRARASLGFLFLMLLFPRRFCFVIHETDYKIGAPAGPRSLRALIDRWMWRRAAEIVFHSRRERDAFAERFGFSPENPRLAIADHGRHFRRRFEGDRSEARRRLKLREAGTLLVAIGFVQPHKGFDRALKAFAKTRGEDIFLRIVGSVRIPWQPAIDCARELHELAAADPRAEFVEAFVDDATFDAWIAAADYVIVPYREIWSSSVAARASLYGRPVIASQAGGLPEQLPPGSFSFGDDAELEAILSRIAAAQASSAASTFA